MKGVQLVSPTIGATYLYAIVILIFGVLYSKIRTTYEGCFKEKVDIAITYTFFHQFS